MTSEIAALLFFIFFVEWQRANRLTERVESLERRLNALQQEHDAVMIAILSDDNEEPTNPRMLS